MDPTIKRLLAEDILRALVHDHLEGRPSHLDALCERIAAKRAEIRATLSALHCEGFYDVLRQRLTLEGFALGVALIDHRRPAERHSIAA